MDHRHAYCHLWITLSTYYGSLLIIIMLTLSLVEVMDNPVIPLSLQGIYLIYLYVGSIGVIISIYIWVLLDSCSLLNENDQQPITSKNYRDSDLTSFTLKFSSLKKVHNFKEQTFDISFYLRIGALAFGIGTLVFNTLETAMHSMMKPTCISDVEFVHPILHGLFTFLQMHFLFVNSQVVVEKFGLIARLGFMHLSATNIALWVRLVIWESGMEYIYYIYLKISVKLMDSERNTYQLQSFPKTLGIIQKTEALKTDFLGNFSLSSLDTYWPISKEHLNNIMDLHNCISTNKLGQIWTSTMPFLYPFIVQFSIIAAGVAYVMGQNVGLEKMATTCSLSSKNQNCTTGKYVRKSTARGPEFNLSSSCRGLLFGLLCIILSTVVIIIFLVMKENLEFPEEHLYWITSSTMAFILTISLFVTILGLFQMRKLIVTKRTTSTLDNILSSTSLIGVQLYSVFGIIIGASLTTYNTTMDKQKYQPVMLLIQSILQLVQATAQSALIQEGLTRCAETRVQQIRAPVKQIITFLLCSNVSLWAMDSFIKQSWIVQEEQLKFIGILGWGIISRISLPLMMFYRFHSAALLLEVLKASHNKYDNTTILTVK